MDVIDTGDGVIVCGFDHVSVDYHGGGGAFTAGSAGGVCVCCCC